METRTQDIEYDLQIQNLQEVEQYNTSYAFTVEEQKAIVDLASKIDVLNRTEIMEFASDTQMAVSEFSKNKVSGYKTYEFGPIGDELTKFIVELRNIKPETKNPIINALRSKKRRLDAYKASFSEVSTNLNESVKFFEKKYSTLRSGIKELDEMKKKTEIYFKELTMYLASSQIRLKQLRMNDLPQALEKAKATGSELDAQKANNLVNAVNRFIRKIETIELSRQVTITIGTQICQINDAYTSLAEEIYNIIFTPIGVSNWLQNLSIQLFADSIESTAKAVVLAREFGEELVLNTQKKVTDASIKAAQIANTPMISTKTIDEATKVYVDGLNKILEITRNGINEFEERQKLIEEKEKLRTQVLIDYTEELTEINVQAALGRKTSSEETTYNAGIVDATGDKPHKLSFNYHSENPKN